MACEELKGRRAHSRSPSQRTAPTCSQNGKGPVLWGKGRGGVDCPIFKSSPVPLYILPLTPTRIPESCGHTTLQTISCSRNSLGYIPPSLCGAVTQTHTQDTNYVNKGESIGEAGVERAITETSRHTNDLPRYKPPPSFSTPGRPGYCPSPSAQPAANSQDVVLGTRSAPPVAHWRRRAYVF